MYQTKTIAGILEPVAQQVSKLIILHEEGEDGNAMPDLERPVTAVSKAVDNLTKVGKDTINSSQDGRLKSEMPRSLSSIEKAAGLLEDACEAMKRDPYSQNGRDRLISGSRGILQGTTSMLITFDESQVRKICRDCKKVLDYLAVSEVIETMEDLVQFVKDLSPCLSKVCQDVDARRRDLLNPYHRDTLGQHLEQVKTLAPILICSMKIFIQILGQQEGKGTEEAVENRNYLAKRMTEEIGDITRILEDTSKDTNDMSKNAMSNNNMASESLTFHEMLQQMTASLSTSNTAKVAHQLTQQNVQRIVEMAFKIADGFEGQTKQEVMAICTELDRLNRSKGQSLATDANARHQMNDIIRRLEHKINEAVIAKIIADLADITTPLKLFTEAVEANEPLGIKRVNVDQRGQNLKVFSSRLSKTANVVAFANARNARRSRALNHLSSRMQTLTPQLVNAGTIRMNYPENKAAEENFDNLRKQFAEGVQSIRDLCDDSMDARIFLQQTEAHIRKSVRSCEDALRARNAAGAVDASALAARLANRLLMALNRESDNSDDPGLKRQVNSTSERLKNAITTFVEKSKNAANNIGDHHRMEDWRSSSQRLLDIVGDATKLFDDLNMYGLDSNRNNNMNGNANNQQIPIVVTPPPPPLNTSSSIPAPPRPPLPQEVRIPGRPPMPDTDDEEGLFTSGPSAQRPIHAAAHGLYQEVNQWDHRDNEIIAAAKKIAYLMAHLSELVRPGRGTKKELIACAKGLAEVSERITELSKELARHCTDKKIRMNLLQVK